VYTLVAANRASMLSLRHGTGPYVRYDARSLLASGLIFNELPEGVLGFRLIAVITGDATLLHLRKHSVNGAAARCSLIDFELAS
jgi:hypothetical protein